MNSSSKRQEIEGKILSYSQKLKSLNGPEDKRIKKRALQAIGKLNKELAELSAPSNVAVTNKKSNDTASSKRKREDNDNDDNDDEGEGASEQQQQQQLTRKQLKAKLKLLNQELGELALKKQLSLARKRFSWGVKKGMEPDVHTYTNLLNCNVRCGDMEGAAAVMREMTSSGNQQLLLQQQQKGRGVGGKNKNSQQQQRKPVLPNVVTYTTLLKGYCDAGMMREARALMFGEMVEVSKSWRFDSFLVFSWQRDAMRDRERDS